MERFNLLAASPEYDDSDPEGYRAGMDRFGPKIGASQIGAVPDTSTRSPTRTAREMPICGSYGEPDEMCCRSLIRAHRLTRRRIAAFYSHPLP